MITKPVRYPPQNSDARKSVSEDNDETSKVFSVTSKKLHSDSWNVLSESNSSDIKYKIDTGAQVNVLPKMSL